MRNKLFYISGSCIEGSKGIGLTLDFSEVIDSAGEIVIRVRCNKITNLVWGEEEKVNYALLDTRIAIDLHIKAFYCR